MTGTAGDPRAADAVTRWGLVASFAGSDDRARAGPDPRVVPDAGLVTTPGADGDGAAGPGSKDPAVSRSRNYRRESPQT